MVSGYTSFGAWNMENKKRLDDSKIRDATRNFQIDQMSWLANMNGTFVLFTHISIGLFM